MTDAGPHHALLGFTEDRELVAVFVVTGRSKVHRDFVTYAS